MQANFTDSFGGLPEIYAYGLRNAWRLNFDQVWAGDMGIESARRLAPMQRVRSLLLQRMLNRGQLQAPA